MAKLLMLGAVNHPHVEHLALAMSVRGFEVIVAGDTISELPPSVLPGAGVPVIAAPDARRGDPIGAARHIRWVRGLLRHVRPDVIHGHWLPGYAFFAAAARAKPLVAMAWGSDVLRARKLQMLANRFALSHADIAMADSQALMDVLIRLGAGRHVLVNWGVDLGVFTPSADRRALRARARPRRRPGGPLPPLADARLQPARDRRCLGARGRAAR